MRTFKVAITRLVEFVNILEIQAESEAMALKMADALGQTAPLSLSSRTEDPSGYIGEIGETTIHEIEEVI